ncbi:MAG TPA: Ku protein [Solirubrobacteraceae bacterium]|jgi:DNA end-binding protein Ku|nr:Ku protein [Solirubrobacteraceae bacterium]
MPRSIWNGTVTFGMVNVPVKLYSAVESKTVHFHEVHLKDGARVEHRRVCAKEEKVVAYEEIVKGYEVSAGRYVVLEAGEVKAAAGDRGKVIHLREFVETAEIDPAFYESTYYVGSRDDRDVYRLLFDALRKTGRAGIGRFSFHDREYLAVIRAGDDLLLLHTLRFHDELVAGSDLEIDLRGRKLSLREVKMAGQLVETLAGRFQPDRYEDEYRAAVLDLISRKAKGEEIDLIAQEEPEHGDDLAAALEGSLAGMRR